MLVCEQLSMMYKLNWIELNWLSHYYNMISLVYLSIWYFHIFCPSPLHPTNHPCMLCMLNANFSALHQHILRLFRWILSSYIQLHKCWMIKHLICMHNGHSNENERKKCYRHFGNGNLFVENNMIALCSEKLWWLSDGADPYSQALQIQLFPQLSSTFLSQTSTSLTITQKYIILNG